MVTKVPKTPVIQTKRRIIDTVVAIWLESSDAAAMETFLTALVPKPKFVIFPISPIVDNNNPAMPIPDGPSSTAINFERIIEMMILKTCTPPNMEVAFMICLYDDSLPGITVFFCCDNYYIERNCMRLKEIA